MSSKDSVTKYSSTERPGYFRLLLDVVRNLPSSSSLGYRLALRNIKAQYRQSMLGLFWAFIPPIVTSALWILLKSQGVSDFSSGDIPYPLYVLTGTLLWQMFSRSITLALKSVEINKALLRKINFNHESLLFSAFFEGLFNMILTLIVIGAVWLYFLSDLNVDASSLLFIPFCVLIMMFGFVLAIFLIPLSSLFRDVQFGVPVVLQVLMYLSPVLYEPQVFTGLAAFLNYNPIAELLVDARNVLLGYGVENSAMYLGMLTLIVTTLLVMGVVAMKVVMRVLIERMGT